MGELAVLIKEKLVEAVETDYQKFHAGLLPGVNDILGVRLPKLRQLAKMAVKKDWPSYLDEDHDSTYEERMIQGLIIGYAGMEIKERKTRLDAFVPKIDNWCVCDCCCNTYKFMKEDQDIWFSYLLGQIGKGTEFSVRFGAVCLMDYFISEEYISKVLDIYDRIHHEGYYVKMGVAWGISMCYVKFPEETEAYLKSNHLDDFTQNKAIQKIRESYQVSREEKEALKELKR